MQLSNSMNVHAEIRRERCGLNGKQWEYWAIRRQHEIARYIRVEYDLARCSFIKGIQRSLMPLTYWML